MIYSGGSQAEDIYPTLSHSLLGAAEFFESSLVDDKEAVLALHEPHAPEPDHLGRDRLPGGPDQVRQVFVRQAQGDHDPLRGLLAVLFAEPEQDLREAVVGPG